MFVKFEVHTFNGTVMEQLAFNAQKFRGSLDLGHSPFQAILRDRVRTVPWIMQVKFEARIFNHVEAIGVYPPKYRGSCVPGHAPFWENF